ncbi:hypothetical protein BV22DRAFT_249690 [Leucogyrophana mollusca]|uniref:Uncharacterized protein n=1 Tax=Leucogyrophana mollusca TaxID=85980 RepID=A0ACB8BSG4_9AGAM|nr:hypothetical protein BV22DRAFT_249690 [Leucogyrophana mollusca]
MLVVRVTIQVNHELVLPPASTVRDVKTAVSKLYPALEGFTVLFRDKGDREADDSMKIVDIEDSAPVADRPWSPPASPIEIRPTALDSANRSPSPAFRLPSCRLGSSAISPSAGSSEQLQSEPLGFAEDTPKTMGESWAHLGVGDFTSEMRSSSRGAVVNAGDEEGDKASVMASLGAGVVANPPTIVAIPSEPSLPDSFSPLTDFVERGRSRAISPDYLRNNDSPRMSDHPGVVRVLRSPSPFDNANPYRRRQYSPEGGFCHYRWGRLSSPDSNRLSPSLHSRSSSPFDYDAAPYPWYGYRGYHQRSFSPDYGTSRRLGYLPSPEASSVVQQGSRDCMLRGCPCPCHDADDPTRAVGPVHRLPSPSAGFHRRRRDSPLDVIKVYGSWDSVPGVARLESGSPDLEWRHRPAHHRKYGNSPSRRQRRRRLSYSLEGRNGEREFGAHLYSPAHFGGRPIVTVLDVTPGWDGVPADGEAP